jgi:hypothetical protein
MKHSDKAAAPRTHLKGGCCIHAKCAAGVQHQHTRQGLAMAQVRAMHNAGVGAAAAAAA